MAETDKPGEVYVFDAANGNWSQQNVLTAGDGVMKDAFGFAVAVAADGSTGLAGAPGKEGPEEGTSPDETTALTSPTWDYEGRFAGAVYVLENL